MVDTTDKNIHLYKKIQNIILKTPLKYILFIYFTVLLLFTLYSYSQIDLNLTLSSSSTYQQFQHFMIGLGYFNRQLSTLIFVNLLFFLYFFYFLIVIYLQKKPIRLSRFWLIIFICFSILLLAYPAFSHDIFNYMFDARIVSKYGLSPYYFNALDFPNDLWTRFMHWTHRYYPYGPIWLFLTLPLSFLGGEKFLPTLFLYKLSFALFSLGNIFLIGKIVEIFASKKKLIIMALFGLNPLVLIESIVSPHNEVMMLFFTLMTLNLVQRSKKILGIMALLLSAGIKFLPLIYFPLIFIPRSFLSSTRFYYGLVLLTSVALIPIITARELYPWYFIPLISFAMLSRDIRLILLGIGTSIGLILRYAPFLYFGDYKQPVPMIQNYLFTISVILSLLAIVWVRAKRYE